MHDGDTKMEIIIEKNNKKNACIPLMTHSHLLQHISLIIAVYFGQVKRILINNLL